MGRRLPVFQLPALNFRAARSEGVYLECDVLFFAGRLDRPQIAAKFVDLPLNVVDVSFEILTNDALHVILNRSGV
jgi:hypothetical protein